jgi:hypothetical protein
MGFCAEYLNLGHFLQTSSLNATGVDAISACDSCSSDQLFGKTISHHLLTFLCAVKSF